MCAMFTEHSDPITTIRALEKHMGKMIWFYLFLITGREDKKIEIQRLKGQRQFQCRSYLDPVKTTLCETKF